jgi:hypothetical protein
LIIIPFTKEKICETTSQLKFGMYQRNYISSGERIWFSHALSRKRRILLQVSAKLCVCHVGMSISLNVPTLWLALPRTWPLQYWVWSLCEYVQMRGFHQKVYRLPGAPWPVYTVDCRWIRCLI